MKPDWHAEELRTWTDTVSGSSLLLLLCGFAYRITTLYFFGNLPLSMVSAFSVLFLVCLAEHRLTAKTSNTRLKKLGCYVYLELLQVCLYLLAVYADHEYSIYHALTSTMICLTYQAGVHMSSWLVVLFMCKHLVFWLVVAFISETGVARQCFPYLTFCVLLFLTQKELKHRQLLAQERVEFCNSLILHERRLQTILAAFPDGLLVLSAKMEIKQWNQELASLLVIPADQQKDTTIAYKCKELLYEGGMKKAKSEGKELWRDAVAVALGDLPPSTLGTTLVKGRYLEWKGSRSTWDQEDVCILTIRDSTNWILMQEQTKRESASKTALLRSVSHELRTPLNAVINLVRGIMEEELLSPKSAEDLLLVSSCSQFLISMINDLLDYSKLIAGKFALVKGWFPLRRTIEQSVKLFVPQCKAKGVDLHLNIDALLPETILSDSNRFKQVLLNLISNAVKFTSKGHIRVIALNTASNKLRIDVIDTGIGIAKNQQGRLFQLFGKLEGNEEINPQGSGLGLNIANALAKELGGRQIELQSEENEGSTFSFFTDMSEDATQTSPFFRCDKLYEIPMEICNYVIVPKLMKSENCCARQHPAPDILLVDDAEFNRLVLRRMLKSLGFSADEAVNGRHALIQIRKAYSEFNHQYKLILMDLEMPEMDGLTAVREIQGLVASGDLPVAPIFIACSAYSAREDKDLCFRAGMSAYLEKPISKESLSSTISSFL